MSSLSKLFGVASLAVLIASCGGGGDSSNSNSSAPPAAPPTTTATLELNSNFNLPDTLCTSITCVPVANVDTSATNSGQITFTGLTFDSRTQSFSRAILRLRGTFTIPDASLRTGTVNGTTGTITDMSQDLNGVVIWRITGLNVSALDFTNANSSADFRTMWRLVANGATNVVGRNISTQSSSSLFCGRNATGASIGLTNTSSSIKQFLLSC